jgi:DNA-binding NarL/FixJ family response regulator
MMAWAKQKVALRSHDGQTVRELRQILSAWCEMHQVADLKSIETLSNESISPLTLIVEPAAALPTASPVTSGPNHEVIRFLASVRQRFPAMRRIVISDLQDLSATIHGLHSGAIDALLHRPFDSVSIFAALRIQRFNRTSAGAA